jgi:hypothetical protein
MVGVALFLSFAALWICDGYYPVGWGWKGTSLHFAFWAMPAALVAGSFMAALAIRGRVVIGLLMIGVVPFVLGLLWTELEIGFSGTQSIQSVWAHLARIGGAVMATAAGAVLVYASGRSTRQH